MRRTLKRHWEMLEGDSALETWKEENLRTNFGIHLETKITRQFTEHQCYEAAKLKLRAFDDETFLADQKQTYLKLIPQIRQWASALMLLLFEHPVKNLELALCGILGCKPEELSDRLEQEELISVRKKDH